MRLFRRISAGLLGLVIALGALGAVAASSPFAVVGSDYINLRSGPGTEYASLSRVGRSQWVEILENYDASWSRVRIVGTGSLGYMSTSLLKRASYHAGETTYVTAAASGFAYLRDYPADDAPVSGTYYNGVQVRVISQTDDGWTYVSLGDSLGYFRSYDIAPRNSGGSFPVGSAVVRSANGGNVNIRSGPGYGYGGIGQVPSGRSVNILLKGAGFWQVVYQGIEGFMDASFLGGSGPVSPPKPPAPVPSTPSGSGSARVAASSRSLNLRDRPSTNARVIRSYRPGTEVRILSRGTDWSRVEIPATGERGYMMSRYLTVYDMVATQTRTIYHPKGSYVNLRASDSLRSQSLLKLPHRSQVTVLSPGSTWTKVRYQKTVGFVMTKYLR